MSTEDAAETPDDDALTTREALGAWWLFGWLISGILWLAGLRHSATSSVVGVLWLVVAAGIFAIGVWRFIVWARASDGAWRTVARPWVLAFAGIFAIGGVYAVVLALV